MFHCSFFFFYSFLSVLFYTSAEERRRIIPLSAAIYFLCNLDRSNIGNARILNSTTKDDMQTELQMTPVQFNVALMVFLVGYFVCDQKPSPLGEVDD